MTLDSRAAFTGLVTAVGELSAPKGGLRVANNVVIRKQGTIEPRQGYVPADPETAFSLINKDVLNVATVADGVVTFHDEERWVAAFNELTLLDSQLRSGGNFFPMRRRLDSFSWATLRGNLYVPWAGGVLKATSNSALRWEPAGMSLRSVLIYATGYNSFTSGPVANGQQVAYRAVAKFTDENGLIVRSRPSVAQVVTVPGTPGADRHSPYLYIITGYPWSAPFVSKLDEIEIYRSRVFPNNAQIDDEMALVATIVREDPRYWSGSVYTFIDDVPDADRGIALYTSPSRGGVESQNDAPPGCAFVETYKGSLFYGNILSPHRIIVSVPEYEEDVTTIDGFGRRNVTGNFASGSPVITGVTPTTGLERGMVLINAGDVTSTTRHIIAISGSNVTLSGNATASVSSRPSSFVDSASLDGGTFWLPMDTFLSYGFSTPTADDGIGVNGISPPEPGYGFTYVIERIERDLPSFGMLATHGHLFNPPVGRWGEDPLESKQDDRPGGIAWSKTDQPEHVPPSNYGLVGDQRKHLLGYCATRDSLFIFKEDGIWRLSGSGGNWRVDPFDLTTFCVLPGSIQRMDNSIFMLSNKGVVRVNENGVEILSLPIRDQVSKLVDDCVANFRALGYYKLSGFSGAPAQVDARNSEYQLAMGDNELTFGGAVLIYNDATGAWKTMSIGTPGEADEVVPTGLARDARGTPMILRAGGMSAADYTEHSVGGELVPATFDQSGTFSITGVSADPDTFYASAAPPLGVGYVVRTVNGLYYPVTEVITSQLFRVATTAPLLPTIIGAATYYLPITCSVQPHGFTQTPVNQKLWTAVSWVFSRLVGPTKLEASFSSAMPTLREALQLVTERLSPAMRDGVAAHYAGAVLRHPVPRVHARGWMLRTRLDWEQAFGSVALELFLSETRDNQRDHPQQSSTGDT